MLRGRPTGRKIAVPPIDIAALTRLVFVDYAYPISLAPLGTLHFGSMNVLQPESESGGVAPAPEAEARFQRDYFAADLFSSSFQGFRTPVLILPHLSPLYSTTTARIPSQSSTAKGIDGPRTLS